MFKFIMFVFYLCFNLFLIKNSIGYDKINCIPNLTYHKPRLSSLTLTENPNQKPYKFTRLYRKI